MAKKNEAVFSGRIVSLRGDEKNGSVTIVCPTIIRSRRSGKFVSTVRDNYPSFSFNGATKTKEITKNFRVGDFVVIHAHMQSYVRMNEHTGDTMESMNAYIDEISHGKSRMETAFGIRGNTYPAGSNDVFLSGEIAGMIRRNNRTLSVRLDVSENGRRNNLNLVYFYAPADTVTKYPIGTSVDIVAELQTINTSDNEQNRRAPRPYQSLVINEMAFAEPQTERKEETMQDIMVEMTENAKTSEYTNLDRRADAPAEETDKVVVIPDIPDIEPDDADNVIEIPGDDGYDDYDDSQGYVEIDDEEDDEKKS